MFDSARIQQRFGAAAPYYDAHAQLQQRVRRRCVELAAMRWPAQATILDVGSGTAAVRREAPWNLIALDLSHGMCRLARQQGAITVNADAAALPFAGASMDGIFSSLMLQWANDPQAILQELLRVLKPSACAVLATLTDGTLAELRQAFLSVDAHPHISDFYTFDAWHSLARKAGFTVAVAHQETEMQYYPDMVSLMKNLKSIGAGNLHPQRRKSMMTPRQFRQVAHDYRLHSLETAGLRVSWQVAYFVLQKI